MNQEKYDKLIAIASTMTLVIMSMGVEKLNIETHHGVNEGDVDVMSLKEIDEFLDGVFEYEVR